VSHQTTERKKRRRRKRTVAFFLSLCFINKPMEEMEVTLGVIRVYFPG